MTNQSQCTVEHPPGVKTPTVILIAFLVWTSIGILFSLQTYAEITEHKKSISLLETFVWLMPQWFIWFGLTFVVAKLGRRFPLKRPLLIQHFSLHLFFCACVALIHLCLDAPLQVWLFQGAASMSVGEGIFVLITKKFHTNVIIYWAILGTFHAIHSFRELERSARKTAELNHQLVLAQLDALKSKLQPHFLFNTLNGISSLMYSDLDRADSMLAALSRFLRKILDAPERQFMTLRQEMEFLDAYLEIEAFRFGDRLTVIRQLDPETLACFVPAFCLQPLVENALKHGIEKKPGAGKLTLRSSLTQTRLRLEILDDGIGAPESEFSSSQGLGIHMTRIRLEKLYAQESEIKIRSSGKNGTHVTLTLPIIDTFSELPI